MKPKSSFAAGLNVIDAYGLTETGFVTIATAENPKSNYAGVLYNKHIARVLLPDGTISSSGTGELLLDGVSLHCATLKDGIEVPRSSEYGTFFRTGDILTIDGDDFYFEGRIKNVIIGESGKTFIPKK